MGEPFELRAGAVASLAGNLALTFVQVQSDSRCPLDAVCVAAGQAIVAVVLSQRSGTSAALSLSRVLSEADAPVCEVTGTMAYCLLSTAAGKSTASTGNVTIELRQLVPRPRTTAPVPSGDYVATFVVSQE
ncbi:MAG TPA: hypothetical protein VJM31_09495 [Vicinamibacterales bacterium]|nr:hypothetical protein [Vicinamibacterales bacterium]